MNAKVLFVDDSEALRLEAEVVFSGYGVMVASSAEEALVMLGRPNELEVILLDVHMPGMGGLAALDRIRRIAPEKSVIIMTGYSTKETAIQALRGRVAGYLEKPFGAKELRDAVENELASRSGQGSAADSDIAEKIAHVKRFIELNCFKKVTLEDAAAAARGRFSF